MLSKIIKSHTNALQMSLYKLVKGFCVGLIHRGKSLEKSENCLKINYYNKDSIRLLNK